MTIHASAGRGLRYTVIAIVGLLATLATVSVGPRLLATEQYLPHGFCYTWQPNLIRLHLVSDSLIGLAYLAIPVSLVRFTRLRADLPFHWMFVLFGVFIVACGATHWMEVWTLWNPQYWLAGMIKAITAAASVPTAILLFLLIPRALALPSTAQLRDAKEALELEVTQRKAAERALQEAHAQLEARVTQRTAELAQANAALEVQKIELAEVDRRKDEFLAVLSHELRNPVHAISTTAAVLARKNSGDKSIADAMQIIDRQIGTLAKLLGDLLDVVRLARKKADLHPEIIDLRTLVDAVARAVPAATTSERRLTVELPSSPVYVLADPVRIEQAVANVVGNAVKYTDTGGAITIGLAVTGSEAVLTVADNGLGIPSSELPQIFDVFMRGTSSQQHAPGGLGLGLHVARELVRAHGGRIDVASEGPGFGSKFVIGLPLSDRTPEVATALPDPLADLVIRMRILVVDDNRDAATSMATLLQTYGHEVAVAFDGASAVTLAEDMQPELILLDIGLPDTDGYAVARRLRALPWRKSPLLVAVTGWGAPADRELAFAAGFDDHLTKPIDFGSLAAIIKASRK